MASASASSSSQPATGRLSLGGSYLYVRSGEKTLAPYTASQEETAKLVKHAIEGNYFNVDFAGDSAEADS